MSRLFHACGAVAVLAAVLAAATACVRVKPSRPSVPARPVPLSPTWRPPPAAATAPARPRKAPAPEAGLPLDTVFAIQIRLDRAACSPGGIDGRWGKKSAAALAAWQEMNGLPATGEPDAESVRRLGGSGGIWTNCTVDPADRAALRPHPSSWLERSKQDSMGFTTLRELLAERYHLYEVALAALNPGVAWPNPPDGAVLRVPDVAARPLPAVHRVEIRVADRLLRAFGADGRLVAQFPCSVAADRAKRPVGKTLRVRACAANPEYTFDPALFADDPSAASIGKRLRIPPGPNNPVGVAWIGLDLPGYGIHGTPAPEKISRTESHGCFRLTNWDARRLLRAIRPDATVEIRP